LRNVHPPGRWPDCRTDGGTGIESSAGTGAGTDGETVLDWAVKMTGIEPENQRKIGGN